MLEQPAERNNSRLPVRALLASFLSLLVPGLGQIYARQGERGAAILLISSDLDELFALCDRIFVMYQGRVAGTVRPHETDERELGLLMTGAYILKAIKMTLHDQLNPRWKEIKDISWREAWALIPLMFLILVTGVWPRWVLDVINAAALRWG